MGSEEVQLWTQIVDAEKRLEKFAQARDREEMNDALFKGLDDREQELVCLGIRAGQHSSAVLVKLEMNTVDGDMLAKKIDKHI